MNFPEDPIAEEHLAAAVQTAQEAQQDLDQARAAPATEADPMQLDDFDALKKKKKKKKVLDDALVRSFQDFEDVELMI